MSLVSEIETIISQNHVDSDISAAYRVRLKEGLLTRDENPRSHVCVYFIPVDVASRQVFIGHHKKSGLWLFNGGHVDPADESLKVAILREMDEEWGFQKTPDDSPFLVTITEITSNPAGRLCQWHFDISYKVPMDKSEVVFDPEKLATEFYECHWMAIAEAQKLAKDPTTVQALTVLAV